MAQPPQGSPVDTLRTQARQAIAANKLQEAYVLYQRLLQAKPADPEARQQINQLAQTLRQQQLVQPLLKQAETQIKTGKFKMAEATLSEALQIDPENKQATSKLRMVQKAAGQAKYGKLIKYGVRGGIALVVIVGGLFAWNRIILSGARDLLIEGKFAEAKEKLDGIFFGVGQGTLKPLKRFADDLIEVESKIPLNEYRSTRVRLNDAAQIDAGHPQVKAWSEKWLQEKDRWVAALVKEGEGQIAADQYDACRKTVQRIDAQESKNPFAAKLQRKCELNEKIFKGVGAFNDRNLPLSLSIATDVLKEKDIEPPETQKATDLKLKSKMARIREAKAVLAHTGAVLSVACSADGRMICTTGGDGFLRAFDMAKFTEVTKPIRVAAGDVFGLALSPDSKFAVTTYFRKVDVYNVGSWTVAHSLAGHDVDKGVRCVAFSPKGTFLASGSEAQVRVWKTANLGEPWMKLTGHAKMVISVSFSGDEKFLATVSDDSTLRTYSVDDSGVKEVHSVNLSQPGPLNCAFSPDSRWLVVGTIVGNIYIYKVGTWDPSEPLVLKEKVQSLAFSPDSKFLAAGASLGTLFVFETEKFKHVWKREKAHLEQINSVAFASDSEHIVSGSKDQFKGWEAEP